MEPPRTESRPRPLFIDDGTLDLGPSIDRVVAKLSAAGIRERALVCLRMTTPVAFLAAYQACTELGAVPVILSPGSTFRRNAKWVGASCLLTEEGPELTIERLGVDALLAPEEIGLILQTSGSTGAPKFVAQRKIANGYQSEALALRLGYVPDDRLLLALPPWSAYGLTLVHVWQRYPVHLVLSSANYPQSVCRTIAAAKATVCDAAPQLYGLILQKLRDNQAMKEQLASMRVWCTGGDYLPPTIARGFQEAFAQPLLDGYGLSEAGGNVAVNGPGKEFAADTVGRPFDGTEVRISAEGEIVVRSPSVMPGYWQDDGTLRRPDTLVDGWLSTGDLGSISDDGFLRVTGRKKNIVIVNGYNVAPEAVEDILRTAAGVDACAVVGVRTPSHGERLVAIVRLGAGEVGAGALRSLVREALGAHCVPQQILIVDEMPYSANGKIDRGTLRRRLESGDALGSPLG